MTHIGNRPLIIIPRNSKPSDPYLVNVVLFFLYAMIINNVGKRILSIEGNLILYGLLLLVVGYTLFRAPLIGSSFFKPAILSIGIGAVLYAISFFVYKTSASTILTFAPQTLVFLFVASALYGVSDYRYFFRRLERHSYFFVLILSLILLARDSFVYVMSFSYFLLLPAMIHFSAIFKMRRLRFIHILLVAYEIVLILLFGSRGPLLVFAIYILFFFVFNAKNRAKAVLYVALFAFAVLLLLAQSDAILSLLSRLGINSRSLTLLFSNLSYDSGRSVLRDIGHDLIAERPLFGWGVAGDSQFMGGGYVHSIWLELQIDFGIFLGMVFFFALLFLFAKAFWVTNFDYRIWMFVCYGFVQLFVSNSYLLCWEFFFGLFLCFNVALKNERMVNYDFILIDLYRRRYYFGRVSSDLDTLRQCDSCSYETLNLTRVSRVK